MITGPWLADCAKYAEDSSLGVLDGAEHVEKELDGEAQGVKGVRT